MLIDGAWVDAADKGTFDSRNPSTNEVWAQIPEATDEDVNSAVLAAQRAFNCGPWAKMSPTERGQYLYKLANALIEKSEIFGRIEAKDTGKLFKETRWQAKYVADFYNFFAGCADKVSGETLPIDKPDLFVFTHREPLGVVAAIVPWNSQMFLSAIKLGPALAQHYSRQGRVKLVQRAASRKVIEPSAVPIFVGGGSTPGTPYEWHLPGSEIPGSGSEPSQEYVALTECIARRLEVDPHVLMGKVL